MWFMSLRLGIVVAVWMFIYHSATSCASILINQEAYLLNALSCALKQICFILSAQSENINIFSTYIAFAYDPSLAEDDHLALSQKGSQIDEKPVHEKGTHVCMSDLPFMSLCKWCKNKRRENWKGLLYVFLMPE